jgi:hypothetical protein
VSDIVRCNFCCTGDPWLWQGAGWLDHHAFVVINDILLLEIISLINMRLNRRISNTRESFINILAQWTQ